MQEKHYITPKKAKQRRLLPQHSPPATPIPPPSSPPRTQNTGAKVGLKLRAKEREEPRRGIEKGLNLVLHKVRIDLGRAVVHNARELVELQPQLLHVRHVLRAQPSPVHKHLEEAVRPLLCRVNEEEASDKRHALAVAHFLVHHAVRLEAVEKRLLARFVLEERVSGKRAPCIWGKGGGGDGG